MAAHQLAVADIFQRIDDVVAHHDDPVPVAVNSKKRKQMSRPENWRQIVEHLRIYGSESTRESFTAELNMYSDAALIMNFRRWKEDLKANKTDVD